MRVHACARVCETETERKNEIEALTEGRRKEEEEKLDPALNSIEGERSQFGSAAEGHIGAVSPLCGKYQCSLSRVDRKWVWAHIRASNIWDLIGQTGRKEAANGC